MTIEMCVYISLIQDEEEHWAKPFSDGGLAGTGTRWVVCFPKQISTRLESTFFKQRRKKSVHIHKQKWTSIISMGISMSTWLHPRDVLKKPIIIFYSVLRPEKPRCLFSVKMPKTIHIAMSAARCVYIAYETDNLSIWAFVNKSTIVRNLLSNLLTFLWPVWLRRPFLHIEVFLLFPHHFSTIWLFHWP